jgi:DNA transposition AAA+ family ATPase
VWAKTASDPAPDPQPDQQAAQHPDEQADERTDEFVVTKEHRRFTEFCDACRRDRYIGYGPPGVGKTLSARRYADWDRLGPLLNGPFSQLALGEAEPNWRTIVYTPTVAAATPRRILQDLVALNDRLAYIAAEDLEHLRYRDQPKHGASPYAELLIVDEADRLGVPALEQLRDHYDRSQLGLVLIGMPGIERRLARYPQLYSRVGFVHEYRPLSSAELAFVLTRHYPDLGLDARDDFTATEALAAIARITGGNLRLTQRLMAQVQRILRINELRTLTKEVVEAARENLVLGVL